MNEIWRDLYLYILYYTLFKLLALFNSGGSAHKRSLKTQYDSMFKKARLIRSALAENPRRS
jgi:hypothetical protein